MFRLVVVEGRNQERRTRKRHTDDIHIVTFHRTFFLFTNQQGFEDFCGKLTARAGTELELTYGVVGVE